MDNGGQAPVPIGAKWFFKIEYVVFFIASRWFLVVIAALLLFPLIWYENPQTRLFSLALPEVATGDEPHYLIMINSLINDGDLDLRNNYQSANAGSHQAGRRFAGQPLDHHARMFIGERYYRWHELYHDSPTKWRRDEQGVPVPTRRRIDIDASNVPEYSGHPPGLALFLAPIVCPFRGTAWVEPIALACSGIATVVAMLLFNRILTTLGSIQLDANLATMLTFLGTPIWHYGRTLFTEPYLVLCVVASYYFGLSKHRLVYAGIFVGCGVLLKGPFILLAIPLAVYGVSNIGLKKTLLFFLPIVLALVVQLCLNQMMFGAPTQLAMPWVSGNPIRGAISLWFSPYKGLLFFLPIILLSLATLPLATANSTELTALVGFCGYFLVIAWWQDWHGGDCFGPRLLVPVLPLLLLGLRRVRRVFSTERYISRLVIVLICCFSVVVNALGAFQPAKYGFNHPLLVSLKEAGGL